MAKLTDIERERIISLYGSQMSVSDITREINKDKPKNLQVSRPAVSLILKEFKSNKNLPKLTPVSKIDNKEVARTIYNRAMETLKERVNKASASELLKIIEYYNILYNFAEEGSEEKVTEITVTVEDGSIENESKD
jgi:hypothetical protein